MPNHSNPLEAGTPAPDWELQSAPDQSLQLTDYRGRTLTMAFMHDLLFANQERLGFDGLLVSAQVLDRPRAVRPRASEPRPRAARARGLPERRPKRRERNSYVLRQRDPHNGGYTPESLLEALRAAA
jgi:hypothetical protein